MKSWLIWKDPDAGKDWRWEEKGMREDEMVGWHHRHNGHRIGWTLGVGDGQGGMACCRPWGCKELDATEWLKWNSMYYFILCITSLNISCKVWISTIPFYRWGNRGLPRWGDLPMVMQVIAKAGTDGNPSLIFLLSCWEPVFSPQNIQQRASSMNWTNPVCTRKSLKVGEEGLMYKRIMFHGFLEVSYPAAQSYLTLCGPMNCSPPGSSTHRIFQASILEWGAISYSRRSSWPRDWTCISASSALAGGFFTTSATWEAL